MSEKVIVRFPPSPTGRLHVGNARTLLFNYLYAKKNGGKIVLRVEDTDKKRSKKEYEEYMLEALGWLGFSYDDFYRQSERTEIYAEYLRKLVDEDKAYESEESYTDEERKLAEEEGRELREKVIRFRNPGKTVVFDDVVLGNIEIDTSDLGDMVIAKDFETPLYHFTVVVDDFLMGITHVIRGADHVANTPRQILLQEAIGAERPVYAHLPLIVGSDGKKLGKRHGATATLDFKDKGYLSSAFCNFLALTGWNPGDDREVFTMYELIAAFSLERIQKSPAVFNEEKLRWINKEHLKGVSDEEYLDNIKRYFVDLKGYSEEQLLKVLPVLRERAMTYKEVEEMVEAGEVGYMFLETNDYEAEDLVWKKSDRESTLLYLKEVRKMIDESEEIDLSEDWKDLIWPYAEEKGRGDVLWPLRYSLATVSKSPDPFLLLEIIGKEEALRRIDIGIEKLS